MAETWKVFFSSFVIVVGDFYHADTINACNLGSVLYAARTGDILCVCVLMLRLRFYALEIHLNVCQHSPEYGNHLNKQHKKLTNRCDKDNMFHSRRPRSMFMCVLAFFCSSHSLGINLFCGIVSSMLPLTNCCRRMAPYLKNLSDFVLFF